MEEKLFKAYPSVKVFYKTSDEQYFIEKGYAQSHAASLKDHDITEVKRKTDKQAEKPSDADQVKTPAATGEPTETPADADTAEADAAKTKKAKGSKKTK